MKKTHLFLIASTLLMLATYPAHAQDLPAHEWNQFRGGNRDGSIDNYNLSDFNQDAPQLLWKKKLGEAFSELSISDRKVFTLTSEKKDSLSGTEFIVAMDEETGKELWRTKIDSMFFDTFGNGPRSTPTIDNDRLYALSSYGILTACSVSDGKILWQIDFKKEYGSKTPRWGFSSSPVIVGNKLIVEAGGTDSRAFIAFDKRTGKEIWKNGDGISSYNSPLIANLDGEKSIVFANGRKIHALNTEGDTLWTYQSPIANPMSMPLAFDGDKLFVSAVRNPGFIVLQVKNHKVTEISRGTSMKNDFSSSIYYKGYIYGFNVAALQCISVITGEKKWTKRGFGKGSLIRVGDDLLVLSDRGKLIQIKASADYYSETGSLQVLDGKSWTAPSFADGKIFIRNLSEVACYQLK